MSFVKNMKKIINFLYHIVDVVTAADLDAEKRVIDSLVQIWKLKVGHIVIFSDFEHKVWSRFQS